MGSARDSAPDASQASGATRVSLPARGWLPPHSRSEPCVSSGFRGDSPRSRGAILASTPPCMAWLPAGIQTPATCYMVWHCCSTHLLESGYDIRAVQELLGHKDVKTTMIYTHVLNRGGLGVRSPVDAL